MKKPRVTRVIKIFAMSFILLGSVCLGAGFASGGSYRYLSITKETATWWPFDGSINSFNFDFDDDRNDSESSDLNTWSETLQEPSDLVIEADAANITIEKGNENVITFKNYETDNVAITKEKQYTHIKAKSNRRIFEKRSIVITLKNDKASDLELNCDAGNIKIRNLELENMELTSDAGNIDITGVKVKESALIEVDAGNIDIRDVHMSNLKIDGDAGNIKYVGALYGHNEVTSDAGNMKFQLRGNKKDYGYEINTNMGKTTIDDATTMSDRHIVEQTDAPNFLKIECDMGSVDVSFVTP